MNKELHWFVSAELPIIFSDILPIFSDLSSVGSLLCSDTSSVAQNEAITSETIPLSSSLKDDHVKGHIKMKGCFITKTELSIDINHTPVPVKTIVSIKEEEHNPWKLSQLGHAANFLKLVQDRCVNISNGNVETEEQAHNELKLLLEDIQKCKLQFVLGKQETSVLNRNYGVFSPDLPVGLLVNFHIRDIKLVLSLSCLKSPQDLHVKDRFSLPKSAYVDRTIMLNVHWMNVVFDKLTELQNEVQEILQKLCILSVPACHKETCLLVSR